MSEQEVNDIRTDLEDKILDLFDGIRETLESWRLSFSYLLEDLNDIGISEEATN